MHKMKKSIGSHERGHYVFHPRDVAFDDLNLVSDISDAPPLDIQFVKDTYRLASPDQFARDMTAKEPTASEYGY
jgi:hypothetical protein